MIAYIFLYVFYNYNNIFYTYYLLLDILLLAFKYIPLRIHAFFVYLVLAGVRRLHIVIIMHNLFLGYLRITIVTNNLCYVGRSFSHREVI